jgi:outer membrane cobalamin receptor
LTAFARRSEDLIDWARAVDEGTDVPWETRNVKEARFKGVEADLSLQGPAETRWTLGGMLLSVDSKEASGYASKYALRPLTEQLNLGVGRSFGDALTLGLNLRRAKRKGEDAYGLVDVRGAFRLGPSWIYLDANNLLDAEYPDVTGAVAPGRAIQVGWKWGGDRNR